MSALFLALACGPGDSGSPGGPAAGEPAHSPALARAAEDRGPLVVFLGDSLTAGYGLGEEEAFPALLGERWRADGLRLRVVNGGVSGDTSRGGLSRVGWFLAQQPDLVVIGLGGNDGLRGLPLEELEANLRGILERVRAAGAEPVLLGQRLPPSLGSAYADGFAELYPRLARELDVPFVPFLLEGVGGRADLNLPDGLHPNREGQRILAGNVDAVLRPLVEALVAAREG